MLEHRITALPDDVNRIIDEHQQCLPDKPVSTFKLAKAFGISVMRASMPIGVSGAIRRDEDGKYTIYASETEPLERRRFTYAHELAHYFLHKDKIGDGVNENMLFRGNQHLSNSDEIEANRIAAEILMPKRYLDELTKSDNMSVTQLALIFEVSREAMLVRLGIPAS